MEQARGQKLHVATVQRDRDSKFTKAMDQALRSKHVKVKLNGYRSPNTNAFVERFVQSIQQECLDRFVILSVGRLIPATHRQVKAPFGLTDVAQTTSVGRET